MRARANPTGPRTPEGKARSAANLDGHPTPEETVRTRFNAMKHGLYAKTATYFPAKPGKYPQCDACQFLIECKHGGPCQKKTELYLRHHVAVETGDPKLLGDLHAEIQASVFAIMQDILISIINTGVQIREPVWYYDKNGSCHFVKYRDGDGERQQLFEIGAHPLLKTLSELLGKNSMSLSDMNLTARQQDEEDIEMGHLKQDGNAEQSLEYQKQSTKALQKLADMVERGKQRTERDPILIEHQQG